MSERTVKPTVGASRAEGRPSAAHRMPTTLPAWITPELVRQTRKTWQPYYKEELSEQDAVTILLGVGRLLEVLSRR